MTNACIRRSVSDNRGLKYPTRLQCEPLESRILLAADFQPATAPDASWLSVDPQSLDEARGATLINATKFTLFDLNETKISAQLEDAPLEFTPEAEARRPIITIPRPDGTFERFAVVDSPIMAPELAAKYPEIRTYAGQGIDDPAATVRFDLTMQGFHAQVLSPNGQYLVDPYYHLDDSVYMSYFAEDFVNDATRVPASGEVLFDNAGIRVFESTNPFAEQAGHDHRQDDVPGGFHVHADGTLHANADHLHDPDDDKCCCPDCLAQRDGELEDIGDHEATFGRQVGQEYEDVAPSVSGYAPITHGSQLRTYRTVVAATGEYTAFHGGTKALGQAAIVTAMNRVNQIYERDVAVRMVLVANNDDVVYTNGGSDPYTNNNGVAMLSENQSNVDSVIMSSNYDVGHVFSTGGGGVASLGVIGQNGAKARGVTGLGSPIGDPFYVDYVAHELGHQFGGNHTFNGDSGSCSGGNRNGGTAFEPGSGSTIQAYAGICGNDNLQNNSDDFFHSVSLEEIVQEITTGTGDSSAVKTNTGNTLPMVSAGADYIIPASTPFELTATGSDADGDTLTYSWEQRDLGPQRDLNASDNGSSPIFRAWDPTTNPTRTFPRLAELLNNTTPIGEQLPTTNWASMDFEVVVRDNRVSGGAIDSDAMSLQVVDTGAPFEVTSQNSSTTWTGGSVQTVSWNIANTTAAPISAANVDILLSIDGGQNFNTILASGVANNGSHSITVPNLPTSQARIKVRGSGNVFFDINNIDFTITPGGPGVNLSQSGGSTQVAEGGTTDTYDIALATTPAGSVSITASADTQTEVSLDGTNYGSSVVVTLNNTASETIFVRAINDTVEEGAHTGTISHAVTATNDPTDYPTGLTIPDVVVSIADDDQTDAILVAIDFDQPAGSNPSNWSSISGGNNSTFTNLIDETGQASGINLTVNETPNGSWQDFAASINASTLPQHANNLANLDGQIYNDADTFQLTYSNLDPMSDYELYVFGLEGFFASIQQQVTIQGDGSAIVFNQDFDQNDLYINDQVGDSSRNLSEYARVVTPDSGGQIAVTVAPLTGTSDVVLGGIAIYEIPQVITCDLDGDSDCDLDDIDDLQINLVDGPQDPSTYDLTGDGQVTIADRDEWLVLAGAMNLASGNPYLLGDADLNGGVDAADFAIWATNKFTNDARWSLGDFSADGAIDANDFAIWSANKFLTSNAPSAGFDNPAFAAFTSESTTQRDLGAHIDDIFGRWSSDDEERLAEVSL